MLITILYHSKLMVECMYNEHTYAHLIDSFYYTFLYLSLLHVSTLTINLLNPNDIYLCRSAALTSRRCILNIYSTNIHTEYFKYAA